MQLKAILLTAAVIATALTGCSETTVIPQYGNIYNVTHTGSTAAAANAAAINKAKDVCEQQYATGVRILDQSTVYQGINKSQQALIKLADKVLSSDKTSTDYEPADHNYKTTLTFKCSK